MRVFRRHPASRWAVPVTVAVVALTVGIAGPVLTAGADPALPPRSAAQLLVDLQTATVTGLSGTVQHRADLGLPALPVTTGDADLTSLLSGQHTLRVWYGGPDRQRLAVLGSMGETDLVRNGDEAWLWSSTGNEATRFAVPAAQDPGPAHVSSTPQEFADQALAAIDPSTVVSTDGTAEVAGRAAYELVLSPRDGQSLVGQVRIAVDAVRHVALRVRVYAAGAAEPALETGFSEVTFAAQDPARFEFQPPSGAVVHEADPTEDPDVGGPAPSVVGSGWTRVLLVPAPDADAEPGDLDAALDTLPRVRGSWGSGRLLSSELFSVLVTDDGRVLAGLVTPERLYAAAG